MNIRLLGIISKIVYKWNGILELKIGLQINKKWQSLISKLIFDKILRKIDTKGNWQIIFGSVNDFQI